MIYDFLNDKGTFRVKNPDKTPYLYFPLTNKDGSLLSSISPNLAGDIKKDNDTFLNIPTSIEDIKNNLLCRREFFIKLNKTNKIVRLSSLSSKTLEAGLLYHKLTKENRELKVEITNFIPYDLNAEVMWIRIKNKTNSSLEISPTSFMPLYGGSAENVRDHRHVNSLLNRLYINKYGITLKPTMIFDEKGHKLNKKLYYSFGFNDKKIAPIGQFPTFDSFFQEGDILEPDAIYKNKIAYSKKIAEFDGKETCAAFKFSKKTIKKNSYTDYVLIMGISNSEETTKKTFLKLDSTNKISTYLEKTISYWQKSTDNLQFDFNDNNLTPWLKWVGLQPTLRKLFGCSFLPHFDYGKGGRGWRDLWQDALSLLLIEPDNTKKLIINNFKGVRIDGSNATIIAKNGDFISDRNSIPRVWMDHGVWPCLTTLEYIHRLNDISILLREVPYFRDNNLMRATSKDLQFDQKDYFLRTKTNKLYKASILEHLLIENLVQFFNVGKHNFIRLENADWNDGLDMAQDLGESVAFSCMYSSNLNTLVSLLEKLKSKTKTIKITREVKLLLDSLKVKPKYNDYKYKQKLLDSYFEKTKLSISGTQENISIDKLISDLKKKSTWLSSHIRKNAWLKVGFFNGYYDNKGCAVEGKVKGHLRMMLTSQVFSIMSGVATEAQIKAIWKNITKHLKDKKHAGFRLNTDFKLTYMDFGRAFGFSYGDKENGAFFNHMIIMLAFALYSRGFIKEGSLVFRSIYKMATSSSAKIYPIIPEYFNSQGRGLYSYLTGSASWYIHTLLTQSLGIKMLWGDLLIEPKLTKEDFTKNTISTSCQILNRKLEITYKRHSLDSTLKAKYAIINNQKINATQNKLLIPGKIIKALSKGKKHKIQVVLG